MSSRRYLVERPAKVDSLPQTNQGNVQFSGNSQKDRQSTTTNKSRGNQKRTKEHSRLSPKLSQWHNHLKRSVFHAGRHLRTKWALFLPTWSPRHAFDRSR